MKLHQSGDKIIVTELRPMSEAPRDGTDILLMSKNNKLFNGCNYGICGDKFTIAGVGSFSPSVFIGWLPMPQYRPDAKHIDKTELYEKLRKLTPRQFAGLAEMNLHGDGSFDELVSKLP